MSTCQARERHRGLSGYGRGRLGVLWGRVLSLRRRGVGRGHQRGKGHRQGCTGTVQIPVFQQDDEPQVGFTTLHFG